MSSTAAPEPRLTGTRRMDALGDTLVDTLEFSVASYNIHRCIGVDYQYDSERTIDVLKELACDLVGLQEVDNRAGRGHDSLQLDHLADSLGMQAVPGLRILRHRGEYGNALLTRHPVSAVRRHDLSYSSREPRGALDVEVEIHGVAVRVVVTHFGLSPYERDYQARRLVEALGDVPPERPLVVLGDINEWLPRARSLRGLNGLLGEAPSQATFPSRAPVFALDRIWIRPRSALRHLAAHRSATARRASDHLPVKADIRLGGNRQHAPGVPRTSAA